MTDKQREAIDMLKAMNSVTVGPMLIAQALGVHPDVLRKHVRDGDYLISKYDICGKRIRFFRKDFLQKIGEIAPPTVHPPEHTDSDRLDELIELIRVQNAMLMEIGAYIKKTAGAATPTE